MAMEFDNARYKLRRFSRNHKTEFPYQIEIKSDWLRKSDVEITRYEELIYAWIEDHPNEPVWDCGLLLTTSGSYHIFWFADPRVAMEFKLKYQNV